MKKRILILGAGNFQLPLIKLAKEKGHHVITADYLHDNPGHALADEHYDVSTTDRTLMLDLARKLKIDAIATFSSDPAMCAVAYVAHHLNLPGPSIESVGVLTHKNLFRQTLERLGLNSPHVYATDGNKVPDGLDENARYVVKPTDSCGSKGVTVSKGSRVEMQAAIELALEFSSAGRVIVEDYIEGSQVHGDGFIVDGHMAHFYLGDQFFFTQNDKRVPISTRWPTHYAANLTNEIKNQVERVAAAVGYRTGAVNIEARITKDRKIYLIEVGPRNGGNYVPIIQERLTGFHYLEGALDAALGQVDLAGITPTQRRASAGAYFVLHSDKKGIYAGLDLNPEIRDHIFFEKQFKNDGSVIEQFTGSHDTVGVVLLEFGSVSERDQLMGKIQRLVKIKFH